MCIREKVIFRVNFRGPFMIQNLKLMLETSCPFCILNELFDVMV